ncbi:MAG TPA: hypothetical protein PLZ36_10210 [Armatimonadota bacterium]|nr:hypothetical protein [Armatimonadota bacterium]
MGMRVSSLVICSIVLTAAVAWGKDTADPAALMARSDAQYYYPTQVGLHDLAVDLVIDELQNSPVGKLATISYYYVNEDRQRFAVAGLDDQYAKFRDDLLGLVDPLSNYLVPRASTNAFHGLDLRVDRVSRQLAGRPDTTYFLLVGTASDAEAMVKEYRVLLDAAGLACQVESVLKDGSRLMARIDNTRVGEKWCIHRVTTRMLVNNAPQWRIEAVEYAQIDGFTMPATITIRQRNALNQPVKGAQDWTIRLTNYRINQGVAAATIPPPPAPPAPPADAPT